MIQNQRLVSVSANNYLIAKVFGSPVLMLSIFGLILRAKYKVLIAWTPYEKKEKIFGDAKWASPADVEKAKLRAKKGLLLYINLPHFSFRALGASYVQNPPKGEVKSITSCTQFTHTVHPIPAPVWTLYFASPVSARP